MKTAKSILLIFLTLLSIPLVKAQENYQEKLSVLIKNSENDFANILGEKMGEEDAAIYYSSKIKFDIGAEFIVQSKETNASVYVLSADYEVAKNLEKEIKKFIRKYYSKKPYKMIEIKNSNDGLYTLEVRKESDIEATIILQVGDDSIDNLRFLMLSILGNEIKN